MTSVEGNRLGSSPEDIAAEQREIAIARPAGRSHAADFSVGVHGARGLFAFSVLVYHVANSGLPSFPLPAVVDGFLHSLKFGVELFFAISGFVIAGTLKRARTPAQFLLNRASRIFPVLWVAILTVTAMSLASGREMPAELHLGPFTLGLALIGNLLALPGLFPVPLFLPPAWTLSYEFGFYVLCFIYLEAKRRWRMDLLLPLLAVGILVATFHPRALFFLCGIVVAAGYLDGPRLAWLSRAPLAMFLVFLYAWTMISTPEPPFFSSVWSWFGDGRILLALVAMAAATLMLQGVSKGYGLFGVFLQTRAMVWLGTVSYSLYIWHPVVMAVVKSLMRSLGIVAMSGPFAQIVFFVLVAPPALLVAHVSQRVLEKRATELVRSFWQRRRPQPAAATVG